MPFTFAHPAFVLPFKDWKNKMSLTALIMGSMAPDFEFLFQMHVAKNLGHHGYGILFFDLPISIILCYGFHNLIRKGLIQNLPFWFRSRLQELLSFNWNHYARKNAFWVLISLLLGILSHVFLDAFTHKDGLFTRLFPFLTHTFLISGFHFPLYLILQMSGSGIGILWLFFYLRKMKPGTDSPKNGMDQMVYWTLFFAIAAYILLVRIILLPQYRSFWDLIIAVLGSGVWALLSTSLIWNYSRIIKLGAESLSE